MIISKIRDIDAGVSALKQKKSRKQKDTLTRKTMARSCILYHDPLLPSNYHSTWSFRERLAWADVEHGESLFHPCMFAFGEDVGSLIHSSIKLCFWTKTKKCWNLIIFVMTPFCYSSQMAVCLVASSLWTEEKSGKTWEFNYINYYCLIAGVVQSFCPFHSLPLKYGVSWSPRWLKNFVSPS